MLHSGRLLRVALLLLIVHSIAISFAAADAEQGYSSLLSQSVHQGKVNYPQLCKDSRLNQYISFLAASDPEKISNQKERLAFWLNAYNAYTLKVICDHYPVKSINDLHSGGLIVGSVLHTTIWDKDFVVINGKPLTLNRIEHKIVRPLFKDTRVHFALVCASKSCPALRSEAFEGSKLDAQLDDQARVFLSDPFRNEFDATNQKASLSKIFDWYGKDFGQDTETLLIFISKFLPAKIAGSIRANPHQWKIEFKSYDWSLNE